ncbi:MAG: DMT family transporter [Dysgonamonadaceae bacterium]|jgi:drug/metabolite transporter (DMT)-like permease|nr:DMT family transporter [Dysgonamonadaceae bacterium]
MTDKHPAGHSALIVAYIIFGLNIPIMKSVLSDGHLSSIDIAFLRFAGSMVFFWISSCFLPKEKVTRRDNILLFLAAMTGIFFNQLMFSFGLARTSPVDAAIINTIGPIMTMILAAFFLKEPVTWMKSAGVFIGVVGALLLIFSNNLHGRENASLEGNCLILGSTLSFVIYLTAFKPLIMRYRPVTLMKWMFLYATVCCLPFCWHSVVAIKYAEVPLHIWLEILYVVLLATFLCYFLVPVGQKYLRPTIVSMYNYVQPVVSSLVSVAVGMDTFGWRKSLATLLIFLGVWVVTQSKSRAQLTSNKKEK